MTNLYIEPTNLQLYLDYRSNHPEYCKDAIVYCQAFRVIERSSRPDLAVPYLQLRDKFLERHYPAHMLKLEFKK